MIKAQSEEIIMEVIMSKESREVEMTQSDTNTLRVHLFRLQKDMKKANSVMATIASQIGITRRGNLTVIGFAAYKPFTMYRRNEDGILEKLNNFTEEELLKMEADNDRD